MFSGLVALLKEVPKEQIYIYFDTSDTLQKLNKLNKLRNRVCHSKVIINQDYKKEIQLFYEVLPKEYKENFKQQITECTKKLIVPSSISTIFND